MTLASGIFVTSISTIVLILPQTASPNLSKVRKKQRSRTLENTETAKERLRLWPRRGQDALQPVQSAAEKTPLRTSSVLAGGGSSHWARRPPTSRIQLLDSYSRPVRRSMQFGSVKPVASRLPGPEKVHSRRSSRRASTQSVPELESLLRQTDSAPLPGSALIPC